MDLAAHFVAHYLVSKIIPNSLNQRRDRHSSIHHLVSMSPPGQTGGQRHYSSVLANDSLTAWA